MDRDRFEANDVEGAVYPAEGPSTGLAPEWIAYRDQLVSYARAGVEGLAPGDPRAAVPEPLRPGRHRVHHSYVWLGGLGAAGAIVAVVVISLAGSVIGSIGSLSELLFVLPVALGIGLASFAVLLAAVFSVQWLSWKNLSYELLPAEFDLYSGILNKKRRHVPYQRVQSVNQQAAVVQRLLGICNVKIDTAGGASNESVELKFVRVSEAEALRSEIFRRKKVLLAGGSIDEFGNAFVGGTVVPSAWMLASAGGDERAVRIAFGEDPETASRPCAPMGSAAVSGPASGNVLDAADEALQDLRGVFGGSEVATGAVSYESGLTNKELLLAGLSGAAGHFGVIVAGILGVASFAAQAFELSIAQWTEEAVEAVAEGTALEGVSSHDAASLIGSAFGSFAWEVALWAVLCVAALWAFSVAGTVVQYGGFKVRRRENRIEVEHGLLQRVFHGVDVDRVQAVVIKQGFVRRLIGYCELSVGKIDSLSSDGSDAGAQASHGMVVHPFVKTSRVPEILDGLIPEFSDIPQETAKPAPAALRRAIVRRCIIRSTTFWLFVAFAAAYVGFGVLGRAGLLAVDPGFSSMVQAAFFAYCGFFALMFAIHAADAVLWFRRSSMGFDRAFASITNGGLSVRTTVMPRKKIQFGFARSNPFQRMARVSTVGATTAAGVGGTEESLWDMSEEYADEWLEWVRPRSSSVTGR